MEKLCCLGPPMKRSENLLDSISGQMDQTRTQSLSAKCTNKSGCPLLQEQFIIQHCQPNAPPVAARPIRGPRPGGQAAQHTQTQICHSNDAQFSFLLYHQYPSAKLSPKKSYSSDGQKLKLYKRTRN